MSAGDPRKLGKKKLAARLAAEPKATKGLPTCPRHLRGRARVAWGFWAEELEGMGIDRRPDAMMLEGACVAYQQAVQADTIVAKEGPVCRLNTVDPQTKYPIEKLKAHPAVSISRSAWAQVRAFGTEFGLSPVSRSRLAVEKNGQAGAEDDLMKILSAPRPEREQVTVN
jgi:P27 family predicted phage terminase small subunit